MYSPPFPPFSDPTQQRLPPPKFVDAPSIHRSPAFAGASTANVPRLQQGNMIVPPPLWPPPAPGYPPPTSAALRPPFPPLSAVTPFASIPFSAATSVCNGPAPLGPTPVPAPYPAPPVKDSRGFIRYTAHVPPPGIPPTAVAPPPKAPVTFPDSSVQTLSAGFAQLGRSSPMMSLPDDPGSKINSDIGAQSNFGNKLPFPPAELVPSQQQVNYVGQQTVLPRPLLETQKTNLFHCSVNGYAGGLPSMPGMPPTAFPVRPVAAPQVPEQSSVDLMTAKDILPRKPLSPPDIKLPQSLEHSDVNCSPDICRCTLSIVPQTNGSLKKCRLPFGLVVHPFKDLKHLSVLQSTVIVRCRTCRTYINPFVRFTDQRHWRCNMCARINDLPDEFHFDPASQKFGEAKRRPEIKSATVEFVASSEYTVRNPQPACYVYILDVSSNAVQTGYLEIFCDTLDSELDRVPGDVRAMIAFIAVDSALHYFYLHGTSIHEFIVPDLDEVCIPWSEDLLIPLKESQEAIRKFLQALPEMFEVTREKHCAMGAAIKSAEQLISEIGGRVTVMLATLPDVGPGALESRENPNLRASKDVHHLAPATDFYKNLALSCCSHQIAIDLFVISSQYCDLATLSEVSKFSAGSVYLYPNLNVFRDSLEVERLRGDLRRYLTRKIGFEAVLRIRCSPGISFRTFFGNFFIRSTDLLALPNINPDSAFGALLTIDEDLPDHPAVFFQVAVLYSSSGGDRRIRVHTLALPASDSVPEIQNGADVQAILALISRMAVDKSVTGSVTDAREALFNCCVDSLGVFHRRMHGSTLTSALLAPRSLSLLPLFVLGLMKHTAFSYGTSIKLDHRVMAMVNFTSLPISLMMLEVYPHLYALQDIVEQEEDPPLLPLSFEYIDRDGVYLMDVGSYLYLYVATNVPDSVCSNLLGVNKRLNIDTTLHDLPKLENPTSEGVIRFIEKLRSNRPLSAPVRIILEDGPERDLFIRRLIQDKTESSFSYVEFLTSIRNELHPR